ncbi:Proline dehydrogenase [Helicosporidium sp. ATCC 50920]|nr:Proline dehydrogenase [Helicosporidium sp. ATCC 50920]|eukprot:KDD76966.1 Proline dehydrogenase [Helicosporidium sp. ATCC 50920]
MPRCHVSTSPPTASSTTTQDSPEERLEQVAEVVAAANEHADKFRSESRSALLLPFDDPKEAFKAKSDLDLVRSLAVFSLCRIQPLVKHSEGILKWSRRLFSAPLVDAVVRATFYRQFVAGANGEDIKPRLKYLADNGIRAILDYAAEDDVEADKDGSSEPNEMVVVRTYAYEGEALCDKRMGIFLKSIEASASADGQGFAAIKVTALGVPTLLERVSVALVAIKRLFASLDADGDGSVTEDQFVEGWRSIFHVEDDAKVREIFRRIDSSEDGRVDYVDWSSKVSVFDMASIAAHCRESGPFVAAVLTQEEQHLLKAMIERVDTLAKAAGAHGVRLMVDAEHSYFQPVIDAVVSHLQADHNRAAPVLYNTYQCYLKDSHERLELDLERARRGGYKFGAKLVRGAYMVLERRRASQQGAESPILETIEETHASYDGAVNVLLDDIARETGTELLVASHNQRSIERCVEGMAARGLSPSSGVYFGQLLGMADNLTFVLGRHGYGAYKYVPFGDVAEVMPYLIRRAQENSDMLGGVAKELSMMRTELWRRWLG